MYLRGEDSPNRRIVSTTAAGSQITGTQRITVNRGETRAAARVTQL